MFCSFLYGSFILCGDMTYSWFSSFHPFQSKLHSATKLKKILQDSKENVVESDVRIKMQPLKDQLTDTVTHLHTIFETHVFIAICRGYWDRMGQVTCLFWVYFLRTNNILGSRLILRLMIFHIPCWFFMRQDVLSFLENRKENRSWYKGSRIAVSVSTLQIYKSSPF